MRGKLFGGVVFFMVLLLMGCASPGEPPAYYGLHALTAAPANTSSTAITIGVGPVFLPDYLDRATIVTRQSPNRLQRHSGRRWAGSLQNEILRVLATHLKTETGSQQVVVFPWGSDFEPDIRFRIDIHTFEGKLAHEMRLNATWSMACPASNKARVVQNSVVVEKITDKGFDSLTEAMGRALSVMGREMAAAVMTTDKPNARDTRQ